MTMWLGDHFNGGLVELSLRLWTLNWYSSSTSFLEYQVRGGKGLVDLSQPADSWTLPQFLILLQLPEENSNEGKFDAKKNFVPVWC